MIKLNTRANRKRLKKFPVLNVQNTVMDVPYVDDGEELHKFDLLIAPNNGNRKRICFVDFHGGSYIFGSRKNNHYFGSKFVEEGFDFISADYVPIDGERGVEDILFDCTACLSYIEKEKAALGIGDDIFVLTGDSAGGHLALMLQALSDSSKLQEDLKLKLNGFKSICVLVNCPVYDYVASVKTDMLNRSGRTRMFGPRSSDDDYLTRHSPRTYISYIESPIFASTCTNDFLRENCVLLKSDMEEFGIRGFEILDISEKDKTISHVHNVINPDAEQSKKVNEAMAKFVLNVIKGHP